jgi:hypothetical protein
MGLTDFEETYQNLLRKVVDFFFFVDQKGVHALNKIVISVKKDILNNKMLERIITSITL